MKSLILLIGLFVVQPASAFLSPISVAIVPPLQFPPSDFSITGVRASALWGRHRDVYGLDLGLVGNNTEQTFTGIGISGIYNYTTGTTTALGLQLAGLANINTNKTQVIGAQLAFGVNSNTADASVLGLQLALANLSEHTAIYGVQAGIYNNARSVWGFQIGLVNVAEDLHGIQIGLINFHTKGLFAVSPIINIGF